VEVCLDRRTFPLYPARFSRHSLSPDKPASLLRLFLPSFPFSLSVKTPPHPHTPQRDSNPLIDRGFGGFSFFLPLFLPVPPLPGTKPSSSPNNALAFFHDDTQRLSPSFPFPPPGWCSFFLFRHAISLPFLEVGHFFLFSRCPFSPPPLPFL